MMRLDVWFHRYENGRDIEGKCESFEYPSISARDLIEISRLQFLARDRSRPKTRSYTRQRYRSGRGLQGVLHRT